MTNTHSAVTLPVIELGDVLSWNVETDVLVVGSGASGLVAAVTAAESGASVIVLEKGRQAGGTTAKSSGGVWVPNNYHLRALGLEDGRDTSLRYMARASRPHLYSPDLPALGLPQWEFELIEVFYDNGAAAFEALEEMGALSTFPLHDLPDYYPAPDAEHVSVGRSLCPRTRTGDPGEGPDMVDQLKDALEQRGGELRVEHRVTAAVRDGGRVVGIVARSPEGAIAARARKAVIFASGGFAHNRDLVNDYLSGPIFGACAVAANVGDFVPIAQNLGCAMRNMNQAWNAPVLLELALRNEPTFKSTFNIVGDSILCVNRYGVRFMNEKAVYHDAVAPMVSWDGMRCEYPNLLAFPVWDAKAMERFRGNPFDGGLMPALDEPDGHVVTGSTFEQLGAKLDRKLRLHRDATGGIRLSPDFADRLASSVRRFNELAAAEVDSDFGRGETAIERHLFTLTANAIAMGTGSPSAASAGPANADAAAGEQSTKHNPTIAPLSERGPYFASILAPGVLDTKGGPMTNRYGQALDHQGRAIPGLYAVGNCAGSPTAHGYWGAGSTLGPMITYAWLAGSHAGGSA